jgi:hypothetical protein
MRNQEQIFENSSSYQSQNNIKTIKTINCQIKQMHEERKKVKQDESQSNIFVEACVN